MLPCFALILASVLWAGGNKPPADMPDSLITRPLPESTNRLLTSRRHMIASSHPLASEAGLSILLAGGNAADAALAVQATLAVVEPESSGPGGGCFILYHDMASDSLYAIDGREELPAGGHAGMFLNEAGEIMPDPMTGGLAVGVPGTIAAMSKLHAKFGELPLPQVLEPAIRLAEDGFPVSDDLSRAIRSQEQRLRRFESSRRLYFKPDGSTYAEGDTLRNPDLAHFLRLWSEDPSAEFFYRGELARTLAQTVQGAPYHPGHLDAEDLANYKAVFREPILGSYRGHDLAVFPPPTSGGITLLEILGLLETRHPKQRNIHKDSVLLEHLDHLCRASRIAFADRAAYLGDWDWHQEIPVFSLIDPDFIDERALAAFHPDEPLTLSSEEGSLEGWNTTHFSIADHRGSLLACTSTIETVCGSALVVPGYGFLLNNELTDFNLIPSDPPAANDIEPGRRPRITALDPDPGEGGKRPRSSMCPVIVYDGKGRPNLAFGSPGGSRIIGTVASVLLLVLDYDLELYEAIAFPRMHCRNLPLEIETFGWNRRVLADSMRVRGWQVAPLQHFPLLQGDVNAVGITPRGARKGSSDPRHDGIPRGG